MPNKKYGKRDKGQAFSESHPPSGKVELPAVQTETEHTHTRNSAEQCEKEHNMATIPGPSGYSLWMQTWLPIIFSFLVIVVIVVQAYIYKKQWKAMTESVDLTRTTFHIDQRAWVFPFDVQSEQNPAGKTFFKILYRNTGKTPALKTSSWVGTTGSIDKIPNSDPPPKPTDAYGLLPPGGVFNTSTVDHPFGPEVIGPVRNGIPLYVFGTIWYEDVFTVKHWTQFCYRVGADLKSFGPCSGHNGTDDTGKGQNPN